MEVGVTPQSHVSVARRRSNDNTRWVPPGPGLETAGLDEAYERARAIDAPVPADAAGVRLVWCRDAEIGWLDLPASRQRYAIVGRHTRCDVVLPSDAAVALRHVLVRATSQVDGQVALHVLDLRSGLGFYLDDDVEQRALAAIGPVALRIGRYALVGLPWGVALPDVRPPAVVIDALRLSMPARSARVTSVTTLPPAPLLEDIVRDVAGPAFGRVTLRRGSTWASVDLPDAVLDAGVLVGRAERCEDRLRAVLTESVSRVHLLLLRERGDVHAFDLASTQGLYADGQRVRRVRLPARGGTLRLASRDPVLLEWHPRTEPP